MARQHWVRIGTSISRAPGNFSASAARTRANSASLVAWSAVIMRL